MAIVNFGNVTGLLALGTVVYLILIYLIKPKPRTLYIPSLMFIMRFRGQSKIVSFFRTLTQNFLFFLQLLALLAMALIIAQPFITVDKDISSKHTVIVMDVSASMQTIDNGIRFQKAIEKAKEVLGDQNTLILAKNVPVVVLERARMQDMRDALNALRPTESGSTIGDAILLAGQVLGDSEGRVIVFSDFLNTNGIKPSTAKVVLKSKKQIVDFVNVAESKKLKNVGFIDLNIDEDSTILFIKNYNDNEEKITLKIGKESKELIIPARSIEQYSFETIYGDSKTSYTEVKIEEKDNLMADNVLYLTSPSARKIKLLFITNKEFEDEKKFYLMNALKSVKDVEITINEPPIVSKERFDVYVFYEVDNNEILPGSIERIKENINTGSVAIIHTQKNIGSIDYKGISPVAITGKANNSFLYVEHVTQYSKDIDFGYLTQFVSAVPLPGAINVVSASNGSNAMVASRSIGQGEVVYYGIGDESDFKFTPYYPIFWSNLLSSAVASVRLKDINLKTDDSIILKKEEKIKKPDGNERVTSTVLTDFAGIYTIGDKDNKRLLTANLLNAEESNINAREQIGEDIAEFNSDIVLEKQKLNIELWLVLLAVLLLIIEMTYIKLRGDV
jgi:hypothetical protein